MAVGRAEITIVADAAEFDRQMRRLGDSARRAFGGFTSGAAQATAQSNLWRDANGRLHDQFGRFAKDTTAGFSAAESSGRRFGGAIASVAGTFTKLLAGSAAMTSLVGVLGNAAVGAANLATELAPAVGIIAALPAAIGLGAAAASTFAVALSGVGEAFSAAASGDAEAFSAAIETLAPSAAAAATAVRDAVPAFQELQSSVQGAFFEGFAASITTAAAALQGPLKDGMTAVAQEASGIVNGLAAVAASDSGIRFIESSFVAVDNAMANLQEPLAALFQAFLDVGFAVNDAFGNTEEFGAGLGGLISQFAAFLSEAAASGEAVSWVTDAIAVFQALGAIISPILGILGSLGEAASAAGGNILGGFGAALQAVDDFLNTAAGVEAMQSVFANFALVASLVGNTLGALLPIIAPLVAELVSGLMPILQALAPILIQIAQLAVPIFQQILAAVLPLVPPLLQLASQILPLVANILGLVVAAAAPLLEVLVNLLVSVLTPLIPALTPILEIFGQLAATLIETVTPVIQVVGDILLWLVNEVIVPYLIPILETVIEIWSVIFTEALGIAKKALVDTAEGILAGMVALKDGISSAINSIKSLWTGLQNAFKAGWDWINSKVFAPMKLGARVMKDALASAWNSIKSGFSSLVDKMEAGADKIADFFSGIWSAIKGAYNALAGGWNRIDISIGPFSIPDWVPGIGGASFHISDIIPDIPRLQESGFSFGTGLTVLHPNEAIVNARDSRGINMLADAMALAASQGGGGLGGDIHVYIGDTEITDMIDVRIEEHDTELAHSARTGSGRR